MCNIPGRNRLTRVSTQGGPEEGTRERGQAAIVRDVGRRRSPDPAEPWKEVGLCSGRGQKPSGGFRQDSSPLGKMDLC